MIVVVVVAWAKERCERNFSNAIIFCCSTVFSVHICLVLSNHFSMTSSSSRWSGSDSEDDFTNVSRKLFQTPNTLGPSLSTAHTQLEDDLPSSGPLAALPSSSPLTALPSSSPKDTPGTPTHRHVDVSSTPPNQESSPGPYLSSIIRGTRQERGAHRRRKGYK